MQGSNASWPVGGATRQSGGNWVGRFEKPEDWNIWASMYSSNLELGQLITVGDAILKWTASGVKFVDAAFATQADFDSFCSKIGTPIAADSTAMVAGVQYTYGAAGWVEAGGGMTWIKPAMNLPGLGSLYGTNDTGFAERYLCEDPFWGFRIKYMNQSSTSGTIKASKWSVAASLNGTASQVAAQSVTINGIPVSNSILAEGGAIGIPSYTSSDIILCNMPNGGIIEIRTNTAAGFYVNYLLAGSGDAPPDGITRTASYATLSGSDYITGNPSVTFPDNGNISGVCMIEFFTYAKKTVIVAVGDSITKGEAGAETGKGTNSPLFMASRINNRIAAATYGTGGRGLDNSILAADGVISNLQPDAILIHVWSPNDGISDGIIGSSISKTINLINRAAKQGIKTIVCTPVPWGYSGASLLLWQKLVSATRKLSGCIVADITAALEDPANPGNLYTKYLGTASDAQKLHPNPQGKLAQAQVIANAASAL